MKILAHNWWKAYIMLLFCGTCTLHTGAQQIARGLTGSNGVFIGFYEYKPVDYNNDPSVKYPLIIFMHGIGERGNGTSDLPNLLNIGIPRYIKDGHPMRFFWNGKWETFLVLSPQLSPAYGGWPTFYVDEMLKHARNNMRIDTNRIYLTGLSLGGGGVWQYAGSSLANAKKFAAIAPVCGTCQGVNWCNFSTAKLPVWAFHAADDGVVGAGCTNGAINNINNCNPQVKPIKTIWPDGNHWIWDRAYDREYNWQSPNLFEWFLGQNKSLPVNILPDAKAGPDITISTNPGTATLNAGTSADADGTIVRYIWKKIGGPNAGNITAPAESNTSVTGLSIAGTYVFELTVVDNRASWKKDSINITVTNGPPLPPPNQLPVANAGEDISFTLPSDSITINGIHSYDPDGSITSYSWSKLSGPAGGTILNNNSATATVTGLETGVYEFRLLVSDNQGGTDEDFVTIRVIAVNVPPVARAGTDTTITLPVNKVTLNASFSVDPDGSIIGYQWSKTEGPDQYAITSGNAAIASVTNLVAGKYTFVVRVWDNQWYPADDTISIIVLPAVHGVNQPPVAIAGSDLVITLPTNWVNLNASSSYDAESDITFKWQKIDGPDTYTLHTPDQIATIAYNFGEGIYRFTVLVTDSEGLTNADTVMVTVNPAPPAPPAENKLPLANAGNDISITLPVNSVNLNAAASADPDGQINAYSWSKISGPVQYFLSSPNAVTSNLSHLVTGTYTFRLEVIDDDGATGVDTITVKVNPAINRSPVANAGNDATITLPVNQITLNGSSSIDPDGSINKYMWTKLSGPAQLTMGSAGSVYCAITNLTEGIYIFRLTVTDNYGLSDEDTVHITVQPTPNIPPVAHAGADTILFFPVSSVVLNGNHSYDPDGSIAGYNWVRVSGPGSATLINSTSGTPTVAGLVPGVHILQLTVTDNKGKTATDQMNITVNSALNRPPVAVAGNDTTISVPSSTVVLNAGQSTDVDGSIVTFAWKQVSGPSNAGIDKPALAICLVNGLEVGEYLFEVMVTDNKGAKSRDTIKVSVVNNFRYVEKLSVYPNPATDFIHIQCVSDTMGMTTIQIIDLNGKTVKKVISEKKQFLLKQQVFIHELKKGIYFVEVTLNNKKMLGKFLRL
jgi:hypothetical protein